MPKRAKTRPTIIPVDCEDKDFDTAPPHDHPVSMPRGSRIGVVSDPGMLFSFENRAEMAPLQPPGSKGEVMTLGPG